MYQLMKDESTASSLLPSFLPSTDTKPATKQPSASLPSLPTTSECTVNVSIYTKSYLEIFQPPFEPSIDRDLGVWLRTFLATSAMAAAVGLTIMAPTMVTGGTVKAGDARGLGIENTVGNVVSLCSWTSCQMSCQCKSAIRKGLGGHTGETKVQSTMRCGVKRGRRWPVKVPQRSGHCPRQDLTWSKTLCCVIVACTGCIMLLDSKPSQPLDRRPPLSLIVATC